MRSDITPSTRANKLRRIRKHLRKHATDMSAARAHDKLAPYGDMTMAVLRKRVAKGKAVH